MPHNPDLDPLFKRLNDIVIEELAKLPANITPAQVDLIVIGTRDDVPFHDLVHIYATRPREVEVVVPTHRDFGPRLPMDH